MQTKEKIGVELRHGYVFFSLEQKWEKKNSSFFNKPRFELRLRKRTKEGWHLFHQPNKYFYNVRACDS